MDDNGYWLGMGSGIALIYTNIKDAESIRIWYYTVLHFGIKTGS